MKATQLLKAQHKEVDALFEKIEKADSPSSKRKLYHQLAHKLVAHDAIEREIFYPACEKEMGLTDELGEALVEHGVVEFSLYVAGQGLDKDDFDARMMVLKEMVKHHVDEEEGTFFPKVEPTLGAKKLEDLGQKMEARFAELVSADYAEPLRDQLNQVLHGALETEPADKRTIAKANGGSKTKANGGKKRAATRSSPSTASGNGTAALR